MNENIDWELKNRRMAWENINTACSTILAARIQIGLFPKADTKATMKELLDMINVEYQAFLNIKSNGDGSSSGGEETTPPVEKKTPWICKSCGKEILYKKVADYSMEHYGEYLCYDCQNKPETVKA